MKRLLALASVLIPIYLFAQGFGSFSHDQPYLAKDTSGSSSNFLDSVPPGVAFWWAASDLTNSPVAAWYDRMQSRAFVQPTGGNQPTWSSNAVIFDSSGTQFLRLTNPVPFWGSGVSTTNLMLVVESITAASGGASKFLLNADNGVNGLDAFVWKSGGGASIRAVAANLFDDTPDVNREIVYGGYDGTNPNYYTNGFWRVSAYSYNANIEFLGRRYDGVLPWQGTIKELIIWTNVAPTGRAYFTTNEILQIHQYVTNKFGPSTF